MDYTEILVAAENKLGAENQNVLDEIKAKIESASTGGEIGSLVGGYLKILRDHNHPAYLLLKNEVDIYLSQFRFK